MATIAVPTPRTRKADRIFFSSMCVLILITVWIGFSKTYYTAGMVTAKLPSPIIHVHAIIFTLWLLTLVTQTALISAGNVRLHRKLGLWGFGLAVLMVVFGLLAATNSLRRNFSPVGSGLDPRTFYIVPVTDMVLFSVLAAWAYRARNRPVEHKRLILLATLAILDAAIDRFPITFGPVSAITLDLIQLGLIAALIVYDIVTLKKVHRVTIIGFVLIAVVMFGRVPLGMTSPWLKFANFMHG